MCRVRCFGLPLFSDNAREASARKVEASAHTALGVGATNGFDEYLALAFCYLFHCSSMHSHIENSQPPWI